MPVSPATLFRLLILLLMAGHGFYMYCLVRNLSETFGTRPLTVLGSALFVAVMMIPFAWAVALPELPELYRWLHGHRRWKAGRCAACGYPVRDVARDQCPECGAAVVEPASYRFSLATVRRFAVMLVAAWLLGSAAGEAWTSQDERAFAREVRELQEAGIDRHYARARRWPTETGELIYAPGSGFSAND